ncbi:MAG: cytochrome c-type biogenesis protein [Gemmatimonadota bacterium]
MRPGVAALIACMLVIVAAFPPRAVAQTQTGAVQIVEEVELDRQTRDVAAQLRCVVCQGLSIQDSPSSLAQEMRAVVREQLAAGKSPDEVKQFFVDKYGEWVLLQPRASGFNLLVYALPVLMLIGGAVFVGVTARRLVSPARHAQQSPGDHTP